MSGPIERVIAYIGSLFGFYAKPDTDLTGGTVPATSVDYGLHPTPGPLTGDAPANFNAALQYWNWNVLSGDVSGQPNYPGSVTSPSQGGSWRDRIARFFDQLDRPYVAPSTPYVEGGPGWVNDIVGRVSKPPPPPAPPPPDLPWIEGQPGWVNDSNGGNSKPPPITIIEPPPIVEPDRWIDYTDDARKKKRTVVSSPVIADQPYREGQPGWVNDVNPGKPPKPPPGVAPTTP